MPSASQRVFLLVLCTFVYEAYAVLDWKFIPAGLCFSTSLSIVNKNISAATVGACQTACEQETAFDCNAFSHSAGYRYCLMYNMTSAQLRMSSGCGERGGTYELIPNAFWTTRFGMCIYGNDDRTVSDVSLLECRTACTEEADFTCISVEYDPSTRSCNLSREDSRSREVRDPCSVGDYDLYERTLWPSWQHRPEQCVEGIVRKSLPDTYPRDCMAACLLEGDFECKSVNYNTNSRICDLYETALENSNMTECLTRNVDNYVKIERRVWNHFEDACTSRSQYYSNSVYTVFGCLEMCETSFPRTCGSIMWSIRSSPICYLVEGSQQTGQPRSKPCHLPSYTYDMYEGVVCGE